jgi:hypothetical protein
VGFLLHLSHVFLAQRRGDAEGHRPWEFCSETLLYPLLSMKHAIVCGTGL